MTENSFRVLIVDDAEIMRKLVHKACTEMGFTDIVEAEDGEAAWSVLESSKPPISLILCDWNMPKLTGLDFLKRTRAHELYKSVYFILITVESDKEQVVAALQHGVDNYVMKPCTLDILKAKIKSTLTRPKSPSPTTPAV